MKKNVLKISAAVLAIIMTGCLDDNKYALDPANTNNVIEFYDMSVPTNPAGAVYPVWTSTTEITLDEDTFEQTISYSGPNGASSSNIDLTVAIDPVALAEYNQQMVKDLHGATYTLMPDSVFEFSDFEATIPAGEKTTSISFKVFPKKFDLDYNYILPLRITSASKGILSAHFSVALLAVVIKNKYDGVYEIMGGSITRNSGTGPDPVLGGDYDEDLEVEFATINAVTCGWEPLWKDGSGVGGVAGTNTAVDESLAPTGPFPTTTTATGNATMKNIAATVNQYFPGPDPLVPDGQKFILNFDWGVAPSTRLIENFEIEWTGPRD